jgi:hypothetical protein
MRSTLFAGMALAALVAGTATAAADEFDDRGQAPNGGQTGPGTYLYYVKQTTGAQPSDASPPDSLRVHGHD